MTTSKPVGTRAGRVFEAFTRARVATKLLLLFAVIMGLNGVAFFIYHVSLKQTSHEFSQLIETRVAMRDDAQRATAWMLQCRTLEKDFVLTRSIAAADQLKQQTEFLQTEAEKIVQAATEVSDESTLDNAKRVIEHAKAYETAFDSLRQAFEVKGLDHESGLQGTFRSVVHDLEHDLKSYDVGQLYEILIKLRRQEQLYINGPTDDSLRQFELLKSTFGEQYVAAFPSAASDSPSETAWNTYCESAERLFDSQRTLDESDFESTQVVMNDAASRLEQQVLGRYVPKAPYLLLMVRRAEKDYLLRGSKKYIDKTHSAVAKLRDAVDTSTLPLSAKQSISQRLDAYLASFDALVAENQHINQLQLELADAVERAEVCLVSIVQGTSQQLAERAESASALANNRARTATFVAFGSVLFAVGLILWVARSMSRSIHQISEAAQEMASGDLTKRIASTRRDELGQLSNAFDQLAGNMQSVIKQINDNSSSLANEGSTLSFTASQLANGASSSSQKSETVAAAAEQLSQNIHSMANNSDNISQNVGTVARSAQELQSSIAEIAQNAEKASGVAGEAAQLATESDQKISDLDTAADEIGKVVDVIQDIAEQTNLLALNATIEAARAGDAGKGFAVVASEVKELSRQTTDATEGIRRRVESIQSTSADAITSIRNVSQVIADADRLSKAIASAVEQQSSTTRDVAASADQTSREMEMMTRGISESVNAGRDIASNIAGVHSASEYTVQGAEETETASVKVAALADELRGVVNQFSV